MGTEFSTLYGCLDRGMWPSGEWKKPRAERRPELSFKDAPSLFLHERWAWLFGSTCDVVLFDLTSTYFEVDGVKTLDSDLQRYGDSRDKRMKTVKMVDIVMPTTDGRVITLPCYVEPKEDVALLFSALGLTLPAQPPPKISGDAAPQKTEV